MLQELDIKKKVHSIATEETMPPWTMAEWNRNVFDGYLPCSILYEDANMLQKMRADAEDGELYCHMVFTHEAAKVCFLSLLHTALHSMKSLTFCMQGKIERIPKTMYAQCFPC
jgi:hypothetical protein